MSLIDYIVYRLYVVYDKHKDPGRLSAFRHLLFMSLIALIFLGVYADVVSADTHFIANTFSAKDRWLIFLGVIVLNIILFFSIYTMKRINRLKARFKGNPWNKIIPNSLILLLPVFEILVGIGGYWLLKRYY